MAFCAKCGAQLAEGSGFCNGCGTAVAAQGGAPATGAAPAPAPAGTASSCLESNLAAALSYLFIPAIIFLAIDPYKNDRFVRFHAFQAIFYCLACWAFSMIWSFLIVGMFFSGGWAAFGLFGTLFWIVRLAMIVGWILAVVKAYNKEQFKLPILGDIAAKQAGV
jgi:uncharacterized membrane protein